MEHVDFLIVGAGLAGLACARALHDAGRAVLVIDKARGVGGRCATRRLDDQPADHGPIFLHGRSAAFHAVLDEVPDGRRWPEVVHGAGRPCHPSTFVAGTTQVAWSEGLTTLPKHLARDLPLALHLPVTRLALGERSIEAHAEGGWTLRANTVVLTPPGPQTRALLKGLAPHSAPIRAARALLGRVDYHPSLSLIARYPTDARAPVWDVRYPDDSDVLQLVANDTSKRADMARTTLVLQARPAFSRAHLDVPPAAWVPRLLAEAGRVLGGWAERPERIHPHRWRYARAEGSALLPRPLLFVLANGARAGLAGELFDPHGGVEGAWRSGDTLARTLLESA